MDQQPNTKERRKGTKIFKLYTKRITRRLKKGKGNQEARNLLIKFQPVLKITNPQGKEITEDEIELLTNKELKEIYESLKELKEEE